MATSAETRPQILEDPAGTISAYLLEAESESTVRIYCGNGAIYNDIRFSSAAERAHEHGVKIDVSVGPILVTYIPGRNEA